MHNIYSAFRTRRKSSELTEADEVPARVYMRPNIAVSSEEGKPSWTTVVTPDAYDEQTWIILVHNPFDKERESSVLPNIAPHSVRSTTRDSVRYTRRYQVYPDGCTAAVDDVFISVNRESGTVPRQSTSVSPGIVRALAPSNPIDSAFIEKFWCCHTGMFVEGCSRQFRGILMSRERKKSKLERSQQSEADLCRPVRTCLRPWSA
ncbi:hypothetical protein B0H11DRAFT_1899852 [Mycena galericulata]|nr:hypothetical protein B0H11DRAFT_1899852 [Mycena galericulata]